MLVVRKIVQNYFNHGNVFLEQSKQALENKIPYKRLRRIFSLSC